MNIVIIQSSLQVLDFCKIQRIYSNEAVLYTSASIPDINHENMLYEDKMMVKGSQQEFMDSGFVIFGTYQQGLPVILRELVLPDGFDRVSPSITFYRGFNSFLSLSDNQSILLLLLLSDFVYESFHLEFPYYLP
ncbi:unnamed protein product [Schistosoma curassoni]|uniref:Uncharacterized protein n=1 Tax=Schistosoma curassoni TaxID=6186 RepID=A0A183K295_9TREM|nr:unnamed protein product [Schistosoma curassoni]